jgi:hypothetical protein
VEGLRAGLRRTFARIARRRARFFFAELHNGESVCLLLLLADTHKSRNGLQQQLGNRAEPAALVQVGRVEWGLCCLLTCTSVIASACFCCWHASCQLTRTHKYRLQDCSSKHFGEKADINKLRCWRSRQHTRNGVGLCQARS